MNIDYINKVALTHDKTSCSDESQSNARHAPDDFGGCYRCTLITAAKTSEPNERDRIDAIASLKPGAPCMYGPVESAAYSYGYKNAIIDAARANQDKAK